MRTAKWTGLAFTALLVMSCVDTKKLGSCTSQASCTDEGAYCDNETGLCVLNCETRPCDPGHFCDPSTKECVETCPYTCSAPPENATIKCEDPCVGFTCNSGFHVCDGARCASDADANACGAECKTCTAPDNGTATCEEGGNCGYKCNMGYYDNGKKGCALGQRFIRDTATKPGEPMVKDNISNLIWQGCAAGLTGVNCDSGTGEKMNWFAAADEDNISVDSTDRDYCGSLTWGGYADWRLPTENQKDPNINDELSSILLKPCSTPPCIDSKAFPNTPTDYAYWSSSPDASNLYNAWVVDFGGGYVYNAGKSDPAYVRCVRSGP